MIEFFGYICALVFGVVVGYFVIVHTVRKSNERFEQLEEERARRSAENDVRFWQILEAHRAQLEAAHGLTDSRLLGDGK